MVEVVLSPISFVCLSTPTVPWPVLTDRITHHLLAVFAAACLAFVAAAPTTAQTDDDLQAAQEETPDNPMAEIFQLASTRDGEPLWASLFRLRESEDRFQTGPASDIYAQLRAQQEAEMGNHAAALRAMDRRRSPRPDPDDLDGPLDEPLDGARAVDAVGMLVEAADTAQVVMVNERHHAASDRLLALELLAPLYNRGFRYLAMEALSTKDSTLAERGYPVSGLTGPYIEEPVFGELVREALRLGYTLVPYDASGAAAEGEDDGLTRQQRRDRKQAQNLVDRIFQGDPEAKVLIHAGYQHISETPTPRFTPMAYELREATDIDPVTADQTRLTEHSDPRFEHPLYREAVRRGRVGDRPVLLLDRSGEPITPVGLGVDRELFVPRTTYADGRPTWMTLGGRRVATSVPVPDCGAPPCIVELRRMDEPLEAVPLDRVEREGRDTVTLYAPPGEALAVVVRATDGEVLQRTGLRLEP